MPLTILVRMPKSLMGTTFREMFCQFSRREVEECRARQKALKRTVLFTNSWEEYKETQETTVTSTKRCAEEEDAGTKEVKRAKDLP